MNKPILLNPIMPKEMSRRIYAALGQSEPTDEQAKFLSVARWLFDEMHDRSDDAIEIQTKAFLDEIKQRECSYDMGDDLVGPTLELVLPKPSRSRGTGYLDGE